MTRPLVRSLTPFPTSGTERKYPTNRQSRSVASGIGGSTTDLPPLRIVLANARQGPCTPTHLEQHLALPTQCMDSWHGCMRRRAGSALVTLRTLWTQHHCERAQQPPPLFPGIPSLLPHCEPPVCCRRPPTENDELFAGEVMASTGVYTYPTVYCNNNIPFPTLWIHLLHLFSRIFLRCLNHIAVSFRLHVHYSRRYGTCMLMCVAPLAQYRICQTMCTSKFQGTLPCPMQACRQS
jgi:hypothetical protein